VTTEGRTSCDAPHS